MLISKPNFLSQVEVHGQALFLGLCFLLFLFSRFPWAAMRTLWLNRPGFCGILIASLSLSQTRSLPYW
jgi:hypothetical protein